LLVSTSFTIAKTCGLLTHARWIEVVADRSNVFNAHLNSESIADVVLRWETETFDGETISTTLRKAPDRIDVTLIAP
jgi:hypothetical protein